MQSFTGVVISNKTLNTVGVKLEYFRKHPKYQKIFKQTTRLLAHNEIEGISVGDVVRIVKSRPYSKLKHFKVSQIISQTQPKPVAKPTGSKKTSSAKSTRKSA